MKSSTGQWLRRWGKDGHGQFGVTCHGQHLDIAQGTGTCSICGFTTTVAEVVAAHGLDITELLQRASSFGEASLADRKD